MGRIVLSDVPKYVSVRGRFDLDSIDSYMKSVVSSEGSPTCSEIYIDVSDLTFIEGDGITVLVNTIEWMVDKGVRVKIATPKTTSPAISYLDDCGFFSLYLGKSLRTEACPRSTTLPFRSVRHIDSYGYLEFIFSPWLAPKLGISEAALAPLVACLKELFNNINDHSSKETGHIHVQWYPNNGRILIALSDIGVGIPTRIRNIRPDLEDAAAIEHAMRDGVTTGSGLRNRGVGLAILKENICGLGGSVTVHSCHGALTIRPGRPIPVVTPVRRPTYFPGTLVNIKLRTDRLERLEDRREDLQW